MENTELDKEIGTEEAIKLKPLNVIVKEVSIEPVGDKKAKKVVLQCQHPDSDNLVKISQLKWENPNNKKLEKVGLWYNLDSQSLIRKGSALATFMQMNGCKKVKDLVGKSIPTILDDKNYLTFKGY